MSFYIVLKCFKYSLMRYNLNGSSRNGEGSNFHKKAKTSFIWTPANFSPFQPARQKKKTRQVGKQFY